MIGRKLFIAVFIAVCLMTSAVVSQASTPSAVLEYTESMAGGLWTYDYTFKNTSSPGSSLFKVFLFFDVTSVVTGSTLPSGWFGTVWEGTNTTSFLQTMSLSPASDIAPGNSLSGFSFTIDHEINDIPFEAEFVNGSGGGISVWRGTTNAAPVVPEPISSVLFLTGAGVLAVRKRFKRK